MIQSHCLVQFHMLFCFLVSVWLVNEYRLMQHLADLCMVYVTEGRRIYFHQLSKYIVLITNIRKVKQIAPV